MEALHDWTSPRFEHELGHLDRGGVTFEYLRRNRQYQDDYRQALESTDSVDTKRLEAEEELSRRWGVMFPGRSISFGSSLSADLASGTLPRRHHH
ncbi:MAG: hypothetical protein J0G97_15425 [Rhizobium pusense]|nr:hypothetical protein [Agrobacterium pusense]